MITCPCPACSAMVPIESPWDAETGVLCLVCETVAQLVYAGGAFRLIRLDKEECKR